MDLKLKGKRALVTGSSSGLGESIVKMLANEGATVIVHGRNEDRAKVVCQEIISNGGMAEIALGDLSTDNGADEVASAALKNGQIDILINNAGMTSHKSWGEATAIDWAEIYNNNVVSYVRMIQRIVPYFQDYYWADSKDEDFEVKRKLIKKNIEFVKYEEMVLATAYFEVNGCNSHFPNIERRNDTIILKYQMRRKYPCDEKHRIIEKINFVIFDPYVTKIKTVIAE